MEPISFEEPFFTFTVMESDPVAHMIGMITAQPLGSPLWFDITGTYVQLFQASTYCTLKPVCGYDRYDNDCYV